MSDRDDFQESEYEDRQNGGYEDEPEEEAWWLAELPGLPEDEEDDYLPTLGQMTG